MRDVVVLKTRQDRLAAEFVESFHPAQVAAERRVRLAKAALGGGSRDAWDLIEAKSDLAEAERARDELARLRAGAVAIAASAREDYVYTVKAAHAREERFERLTGWAFAISFAAIAVGMFLAA